MVLDWDDDATGQLDYYTVYRSISSVVTTNDTLTNMTSSSYTDSAVTNGITYFYAVTATDTNGTISGLSDEVSATPEAVSTNAIPFQHLDATIASSVTANGSGEVSVWADQSGNGRDAVDSLGDPVLYPSASLSATGLPGMDVRSTRALWNDEAAQIQTFTDYWMESWGVDLGATTNDYDGDGIVNWAEYATGGNPTNALNIGAVPMLEQADEALNYVYARRNDDSDLVYTVETSTNLTSGVWTPAGGNPEIKETAGTFDDVRHGIPADGPHAFFQQKIEQNQEL